MADPPKRRPRQRGNREGRPYQRGDGLWVAKAYHPNGKPKYCYGKTSKEAKAKRDKFYEEVAAGRAITVGRTDTLATYLERRWLTVTLPQRVAANRLDEDTFDGYEDTVRLHIVPHLGRVKLVDLDAHHIRTWLLELAEKPSGRQRRKLRPGEDTLPEPAKLSARTQAICHAVLKKALNDAKADKLISENPCEIVDPPVVKRKEKHPPTRGQATALLGASAGDRLWAMWLVIIALGLRRGEALGMRWSLTDLDAGTARLAKQITRRRGKRDPETGRRKGRLVEKDLKTDESMAVMRLPEVAVEALREHGKAQKVERLAAKVWADPDLIFTTTIGTPLQPRNVNRAWDAVCERAGTPKFRIHDLRHACATYLFAAGLDLKVIQSTLRHTQLSTTADLYTHMVEEIRAGAADTMDGVLRDVTGRAKEA